MYLGSETSYLNGFIWAAGVGSLAIVLYPLYRMTFPTVDPREPPILHPKIPIFGHVVSFIRENTAMFERLYYTETQSPICTLPMLSGYLYVINKPSLIAAAMRNRALDFDPFTVEFVSKIMGMTKRQKELFGSPSAMVEANRIFQSSLGGDNGPPMNDRALGHMAVVLNTITAPDGFDVTDAFVWLRDLLAMASMKGMFGEDNPFGHEEIQTFWEFEKGVGLLGLGIAPGLIAPEAMAARKRGQEKMAPFYVNQLDQGDDVSALVRDRGALYRRLGIPDEEISIIEYTMPFIAIINSAPTLFWLFVHVFADMDLLSRIRSEVESITAIETDGGDRIAATIDATRLDKTCPALFASYREALRLYSDQLGNRRVMADTTLRDPDTGRDYLLKKDVNVQWVSKLPHRFASVWGTDAAEYRYARFLIPPSPDIEKRRRAAMIPFGGGKHLCPGRNFAQAEILGLISALALGFGVVGTRVPASTVPYMGTAMRRPDWGNGNPGVKLIRRQGWERVHWSFECGVKSKK